MGETTVETTSTARVVEGDDTVIVWIDGPFETRSFQIPVADAHTFSGLSSTLDCRAIIYRCDRGGGRLRVLYPTDSHRIKEIVVEYDLRDYDDHHHNTGEATVSTVKHDLNPMSDEEIEREWTVVWEPGSEDEEVDDADD